MTLYCGIDLHSNNSLISLIDDDNRLISEKRLDNNLKAIEQQDIVGVVNLNPGANLNLRDRPSADARVVVGIPSGDAMIR